MGEEEGSWDTTIEEWLIGEGHCMAGALAQQADGALYAAAPVADEAGWGLVHKDDHEEDIQQEDGTAKKMTITEATGFIAAAKGDRAELQKVGGLWIGGEKYTMTQVTDEDAGDGTVKCVGAMRPKKGLFIVSTTSQYVLAMFSEEKGQSAGNCKKAILAFAEYLVGEGY
jgi:hypothetical protein